MENKVIADKFEQICPTGYVWVPGSAKHGTLPGFCVMKYEAKDAGGGVAESKAADAPWTSVTQENARAYCQALGEGYHLVSEAEWMTIAENIAATPINDIDAVAGLQLATGHTDNDPANSWPPAPIRWFRGATCACRLSDAANAFDAIANCAIMAGKSMAIRAPVVIFGTISAILPGATTNPNCVSTPCPTATPSGTSPAMCGNGPTKFPFAPSIPMI